ncbi:MAG: D-glycerate dehydrogenase [Elusimicrobia bacterium]|jgi:glyoxylate reductase|nr:D-glycerate dehydrogenase [Elusimicrobiota bacterium]MBK8652063.1 D-glycerate dehydrogenase [Elusimicrobiota bacterium]MBP8004279.1 D-glycerate dehydrogenase [Elusimicrobiota bacterium]
MKTVLVTRRVPEPGLALLRSRGFRVVVPEKDRPLPRADLLRWVKNADGLLTQLVDRVDAGVFAAAPRLRVVANYAVGHDNIDKEAARERGVVVTNTPDVLTEATAEMAWALLLGAARRIVEGDRGVRAGDFKGWAPGLHLGQGVSGKILGVVGAGRIGAAVARMSTGFRMRVLYWGRSRNRVLEKAVGARRVPLDRLLRESDFVTLHVPGSAATRHMIGRRELALMKPTAVLVNTARGTIVDEKALVTALRKKRVFAAGLDVYEKEPLLAPGLARLPNAVLAPHAGSATLETRTRMATLAAGNIAAVLAGHKPLTPV